MFVRMCMYAGGECVCKSVCVCMYVCMYTYIIYIPVYYTHN